MRTMRQLLAFLCVTALGLSSGQAAESPQDLYEELVPPDVVLAHAAELGLEAGQRQAVQRILAELHPQTRPLLEQMRKQRDDLVKLLQAPQPDEAAVLAQFDRLNAVETELKRLRLRMSARTKPLLTPEQQAQAIVFQRKRLGGAGAGAGAESIPARLRRVRDGIEQWKREGRDVTRLRDAWERFREAERRGFYRQAREALDEAVALLEAPAASR